MFSFHLPIWWFSLFLYLPARSQPHLSLWLLSNQPHLHLHLLLMLVFGLAFVSIFGLKLCKFFGLDLHICVIVFICYLKSGQLHFFNCPILFVICQICAISTPHVWSSRDQHHFCLYFISFIFMLFFFGICGFLHLPSSCQSLAPSDYRVTNPIPLYLSRQGYRGKYCAWIFFQCKALEENIAPGYFFNASLWSKILRLNIFSMQGYRGKYCSWMNIHEWKSFQYQTMEENI